MTQKAEPVVSNVSSKFNPKSLFKHINVAIIVVVLVVVVVVALLINNFRDEHTSVCSASQIRTAASYFFQSTTSQLTVEASKIKSLKNYQSDPNCMYIVTVSYIFKGNAAEAQAGLNQFNKIYSGQTLNSLLLKYSSVAGLRAKVATLNQQAKDVEGNVLDLSPNLGATVKK